MSNSDTTSEDGTRGTTSGRALRLRSARIGAGFTTVVAASERNGWTMPAYGHHENGTRGFGVEQARAYADAYGVQTDWLLGIDEGVVRRRTMGERLIDIRRRSNLSLARLARDGGWRGASSIQKIFKETYDRHVLSPQMAHRIVVAFEMNDVCTELRDEVLALSRSPVQERQPHMQGPGTGSMPVRNVHRLTGDVLDLNRLRPCDRLAMSALYESLLMLAD